MTRRRNARDRLAWRRLVVGWVGWVGLAGLAPLLAPDGAPAQERRLPELREEGRVPEQRALPDIRARSDLLRRIQELDRLITLGSLSRARTLLNELEQHEFLRPHLLPLRIRLAQAEGAHDEAIELCRRALANNDRNPQLWRQLAASLLDLERWDEAREALDRFVATSPNRRSAFTVAVDILERAAGPRLALAVIDSARTMLAEPRFLGRERALSLLRLDRQEDAADEVAVELRQHPFNLPLVRNSLLDGAFDTGLHGRFLARLASRAAQTNASAAEAILVADLQLSGGEVGPAIAAVEALYSSTDAAIQLLQDAATLTRELPLLADQPELRAARVEFLIQILERLGTTAALGSSIQMRSLESLAEVYEFALDHGDLAADPREAARRFSAALELLRERNPRSRHLYSAQIRLAHYTRDVLGEPLQAAARLERLLTNLDLPTEGVAIARLTLGECYLAAGDTARGRTVLTRLGKDPAFRDAAGHAHYHLARLDLAERHYETARDRFATVALDNPLAAYANDALELGLSVAEELQNPTGGPAILDLYAPSVYYAVTAQPDSQRVALERFVATAAARLDLEADQFLLERGRFELAHLYHAQQRPQDALAQLDRIVLDHPNGRYPAAALAYAGEILDEMGDEPRARETYERLLLQYPDYLFGDDVRERLRSLP